MIKARTDPRASTTAVPVLLLTVFISLIGFGIVIPLLPFFASAFKAEAWQVTLMFSTFSAGAFVGEMFWGRLSDRFGRKPVLLATIIGSVACYAALAFAPDIWVAIVARGLGGFFSGNTSTVQSYIIDVSPREKTPGRLGLVGAAYGVGFVVGPTIGGLLAHPELGTAGFRPPLAVASALCIVAGLGVMFFVRESRNPDQPRPLKVGPAMAFRRALAQPNLAALLLTTFAVFGALSALWSILGLWGNARFGWGPREVGFALAISGMVSAVVQGLAVGPLMRRLGAGRTIVFGLLVASAAFTVQAFAPWVGLAVAALVVGVIGQAVAQPAVTTLAAQVGPPERQGATLGAINATASLSRVGGPAIAGLLFSSIGPHAPLLFAAVGLLPAAWIGWRTAVALQATESP